MRHRNLGPIAIFTFFVTGLATSAAGCGDDNAPVGPTGEMRDAQIPRFDGATDGQVRDGAPSDGNAMDGGARDATTDAFVPEPEQCTDPARPIVEITAPEEATDPNTDEVIVTDRVTVQCRVTGSTEDGAFPIDPESIGVVLLDAIGNVLAAPTVSRPTGDEYVATFDLTQVENGPIVFRCTGLDMAPVPRCGLAEVMTFNDQGPEIQVMSPTSGSVHRDVMALRYNVLPSPLTMGDMEADVAGHTLTVAGRTITAITEIAPGEFSATIDFNDTTIFGSILDDLYELSIRAVNGRTSIASDRVHRQPFRLDRVGPTIEFDVPSDGDIVGGLVTVRAEITDPAGVDQSSVVLRAGMMELAMTPIGMNRYEASFDASSFGTTVVELTLNITARDSAGNPRTGSVNVKLDGVPPFVSLDPPTIREGRIRSGGVLECSDLFDPIGIDSVVDGQVVGTAAEFRARAEDRGNSPFGSNGSAIFIGGVDEAEVDLLILDDTTMPLLVDTDGDMICDAINSMVEPAPGNPNSATVVELVPIRPTGTAQFTNDPTYDPDSGDPPVVTMPGDPPEAYAGVFDGCENPNATNNPAALCPETTGVTRVISTTYSANTAAIFAKPPLTNLTCVGDAFDFQSSIAEGWACVAVRAKDSVGNIGLSVPLRVCFVASSGSLACPAPVGTIVDEAMRPDCTDSCIPPESFADRPGYQLYVRP